MATRLFSIVFSSGGIARKFDERDMAGDSTRETLRLRRGSPPPSSSSPPAAARRGRRWRRDLPGLAGAGDARLDRPPLGDELLAPPGGHGGQLEEVERGR